MLRIKFSADIQFSASKSASSPSAKPLVKIKILMQSNKPYHIIFKYGLPGIGILMLAISLLSWLLPKLIVLNGKPMEKDIFITIVFALIGVFLIILFYAIKNKFVMVTMGNQSIVIKTDSFEKKLNSMDVESLSFFQFVYPPLYRIKIKESKNTYWFNTENQFINAGGFTSDTSEMGDLIKKKKRELGI